MNTTTSSSRGSTSSPYSFPDPDEVEIGLLGAIKAHIIAVPGLFFIMLVIDMFIVIISPYLIPVREVFTLSFILAGTLTMSRARSDDESMRIGTWILGSLYIGLGIWLII
jgi:hypothetical protein